MIVFYRNGFSQIRIVLRANESLALIGPNAYLEDRNGNVNYINILKVGTTQCWDILTTESASEESAGTLHTVFSGWFNIDASFDGGIYQIEGFIRDSVGNYRDLSQVEALSFRVLAGVIPSPLELIPDTTPIALSLEGVFPDLLELRMDGSDVMQIDAIQMRLAQIMRR